MERIRTSGSSTCWGTSPRPIPAQHQSRKIVDRFCARYKRCDIGANAVDNAARRRTLAVDPGQASFEAPAAIEHARRILRIGDAIGNAAQRLTLPHLTACSAIVEAIDHA